jgi:hypothetical protein
LVCDKGFSSVYHTLLAEGIDWPGGVHGLQHSVVDLVEKQYFRSNCGLGSIFPPFVNEMFLEIFQRDSMCDVTDDVKGNSKVTATSSKSSVEYLNAVDTYEQYLVNLREPSAWLDNFLLNFLPYVVNRKVCVYSECSHKWHVYDIPNESPSREFVLPLFLLRTDKFYRPMLFQRRTPRPPPVVVDV